jgi:hypothetical protein
MEKQALILSNAVEQVESHPNDKDRFLFIEIALQNLKDDRIQAERFYFENDLEDLYMFKNKIPENKLEELKIIATKLYKISAFIYETSNSKIAGIDESYISTFEQKQNAVGEAFTYCILYKNENPNDESNIKCDEYFNLWSNKAIPKKSNKAIPKKSKNHKKKHHKR